MPANAKVFLAEDDESICFMACESLQDFGHAVVMKATTVKEALDALPILKSLGVNVAVIDGNLTPRQNTGKDGLEISSRIRELSLGIKIVAFSADKQDWGDVMMKKPCSTLALAAMITSL